MLKRKALRKIFITTFSCFVLLCVYLIPTKINDNYLDTDYEIMYTSQTVNQEIYLLGENNYLVKFNVFLDGEEEEKVKKIISYLKVSTKEKIPNGLIGIIPSNTKVLDIDIDDDIVTIDFSKELLNVDIKLEERLIEAIVYSVTGISDIDGVSIKVGGEYLTKLPQSNKSIDKVLTRDFGINKVYDITNRNGIQKVVIYYLDKISNNNYYVPVTKYVNDDRDKIKIIVENLASSYIYEENLYSYLNSKTTILDYSNEDGIFILDLNDAVFKNDVLLEEVEYTLSYSIFDNYDVNKILLKVNGDIFKEIEKY